MFTRIQPLFLIYALFLLSACDPVYVIENEYVPPTDRDAQGCLGACQAKRETCQNRCRRDYHQCLDQAAERARAVMPELEQAYTGELEEYVLERDHYDLERENWTLKKEELEREYDLLKQQCRKFPKQKDYCDDKRSKRGALSRHDWNEPKAPKAPDKPSLNDEIERQQAGCSQECGCGKVYDGCYVSCGGRVIPHQVCIEHCP